MNASNPEKTTVYITRHGFSEHNTRSDVFMGRSPDSRLTETGKDQARRLGERLARENRIDAIICSSLPRTVETATIIGELAGVANLYQEDAFWELSKGDWEGVMPRELSPEIQAKIDQDPFAFQYDGGESYGDIVARAAPVFENRILENPGKTLLFVLHGDIIRALLYHTIRFPKGKISDFSVDPCSLSELQAQQGHYHLVRWNDSSHLE